ncbi:petC-1 [Symbiodinium sp. CCMP2456]|nr:petC-1 [Symbiodinium sp. CCMP2456]
MAGKKLLLLACGALLLRHALEAVSFVGPVRQPARISLLARPADGSDDKAAQPPQYSSRRSLAGALPVALVTTLLVWQKGVAPAWALIMNKPPKPVIAQDKNWQQVDVASWVKSAKGQPDLVLGLRGEAYFLLPGKDGGAIRNFALKAECTHLGCLASWNRVGNKFVCPCHGSQYDENGSVLKGPAPNSLALAHVELTETQQVRLAPWTEEDFRDGSSPWWFA